MRIGKKIYNMTVLTELLKGSPEIIVTLVRNSRDVILTGEHSIRVKKRAEIMEFLEGNTKGIIAIDVDSRLTELSVHFELESDLAMFLVRFQ